MHQRAKTIKLFEKPHDVGFAVILRYGTKGRGNR